MLLLIIAVPTLVLPRRAVIAIAQAWGRSTLWLLHTVCRLDVEWRGLEKIPPGGIVVAAKHQSAWETVVLATLFADPAFVVKRELYWLPVFGWCIRKGGMIPVDRGAGKAAVAVMVEQARRAIAQRRQIIIFPEGTRRPPGAAPKYKYGIAHLYAACGAPCVPIALNSGLYWPRRSFLRFPGTVRLEVLDPILPWPRPRRLLRRSGALLEAATARLIEEGRRELGAVE